MEYIVNNKEQLTKAEEAFNSYPKNFRDQIDSIKVHSYGSILLISLKSPWDNKVILPSNLWKVTIGEKNWLEASADNARITMKVNDINKLDITFNAEFKI